MSFKKSTGSKGWLSEDLTAEQTVNSHFINTFILILQNFNILRDMKSDYGFKVILFTSSVNLTTLQKPEAFFLKNSL